MSIAEVLDMPVTPQPLVPPSPPRASETMTFFGRLAAMRVSVLGSWGQRAYEEDIIQGRFFGHSSFILNTPDEIKHVLVDNYENYTRIPAAFRVLRPVLGEGLLIAELFVGEGVSGLGIARGPHQVEQIARRRAFVLAGGPAFGHQHGHETGPALAEAGAGEILRARPALRQYHIENMRPRQPRAILHDKIAQRRAVPAHLEGKHRASGNLERHPLHRLAQIDRRAASCLQLRDRLVGRR